MDLQVEGVQAELTRRDIGSAAPRRNSDTSDTSAAAKFFRRSMLTRGQLGGLDQRAGQAGAGACQGCGITAGASARLDSGTSREAPTAGACKAIPHRPFSRAEIAKPPMWEIKAEAIEKLLVSVLCEVIRFQGGAIECCGPRRDLTLKR